jgi:hypothetical protein
MLRRSSLDITFVIGAKKIHALDWIIYSSVASTSKMYVSHDKTVVYRIHKGAICIDAERKEMERMKDEVRQYCARNLPKGK